MANILDTTQLALPDSVAKKIWEKPEQGSVVAKLSAAEPMLFGNHDVMVFDEKPKAEIVGEGEDKSPSDFKFKSVKVLPRKAQVTMRFNEEVLIANEDYQLEVLSTLARGGRQALLRAVDLVAIHGINPLSGEKIPEITNNIAATENQIEMGDDPELDIEGATGLIIADGMLPNGVALDTLHAFNLSTARYQDGRRKFPDIALNVAQPYSIGGLMAATSDTVSAAKEATAATNVKAVVGDWTAARWGIQRDMGVELIRYGDPDGRGDLKRKNQIAMRLEIFFGVGVMDLDAFAVVKAPAA